METDHSNSTSVTISNISCFSNGSGGTGSEEFCKEFKHIPYIYLAFSCLSAVCCFVVFLTFCFFPRLSGYSSNVFLFRTLLDLVIAGGHIISIPANLVVENAQGCDILGCVFQFSLVAANMWYAFLAYDLVKAIRNPFGSRPSSGWQSHILVWGVSGCTVIGLIISQVIKIGPGSSMFFICWFSVTDPEATVTDFAMTSLILYYLPHFILWLFSLFVIVASVYILNGHMPASSETRRHVLKQNVVYVLVLGMESFIIIPIWIIQLIVLSNSRGLVFRNGISFVLAVIFAVVHSLRGTVDLIVWWLTFSIGPKDFTSFLNRLRIKFKSKLYIPESSLRTPLVAQPDSRFNKVLRRDVVYCINYGILDAVRLNADDEKQRVRLGSVRDPLVAHLMVRWEEHNQQQEAEVIHADPLVQEVHRRKIQFQPSLGQHDFAFIDIEPTIFGLLRSSYGIIPTVYQQSFLIKDELDVESSGMLEKFTEGKSGSFFYFTRDFRYIIKTVTAEEERFLQKIAYRYYSYMQKNPDSLIVRLYGMHKVRLAREQRYITVVVMDNIFYNSEMLSMHERYDLKGSKIGRRVLKGNEKPGSKFKKTLKDLDMNSRVVIGSDSKEQLIEQLQSDVEFLASVKIMDYSMLLGIHHHSADKSVHQRSTPIEVQGGGDFTMVGPVNDNPDTAISTPSSTLERGHMFANSTFGNGRFHSLEVSDSVVVEESMTYRSPYVPWHQRDYGGLRSYSPHHPLNQEGSSTKQDISTEVSEIIDSPVDTYFFGIVDILQEFNFSKKLEHFTKTKILMKDSHLISAVNEKEYASRFVKAMERIFE